MPEKKAHDIKVGEAMLPVEGDTRQIGERLRILRAERDLTILELAAKAGVSAGIISQIERGNSNPSMKTLQRLRAALGVNLWEFLERSGGAATTQDAPFVRRAAQRPRIVVGETRLVKELLSPRHDENLRFMFVTLPPGGISEDVLIGTGQKGGYVMSGRVELTVGERTALLEEGDSFQFRSNTPHHIANRSDQEAKLLWIMSVLDTHL
ncbi:helix-turn-helix domain-containing protein [Chelatococcus asaccharovorans]|uniref:helix-turn-helix domain-containing protein n=1 Tax=Chelatococcus asaccharovorans TaxID=28210 RepID=UPI00224C72F5|nr:XRE family transcriptional regulator [Chelatococcus asaccharovorans]CAH1658885.1 XRE family transcriptional regulator [Chelatococcus asaccharovorans]CAH1688318.1 XRE family transcriptional regulator [Chelatococcus asaccharovorans]